MTNEPNSETPETPTEWKQEFDFTEDPQGWKPFAPDNSVEEAVPLTEHVTGEGFVSQNTTPYAQTAKPETPFETTIKALRPFMKSFGIGNEQRVKLRIDATADASEVEAAIRAAGKKVERGLGGVVYVPFEALTNKEAKKIVAQEFSEVQADADESGDAQDE